MKKVEVYGTSGKEYAEELEKIRMKAILPEYSSLVATINNALGPWDETAGSRATRITQITDLRRTVIELVTSHGQLDPNDTIQTDLLAAIVDKSRALESKILMKTNIPKVDVGNWIIKAFNQTLPQAKQLPI